MIILIPAYEPTEKILLLIDEINQNSNYSILIVNDGSTENCLPIFEQAANKGCIILSHDSNQGKGAALKTAFSYIIRHLSDNDGVVCADCDGQHSWKDIQQVAAALPSYQNTLVLGSREFTGKVPLKSLIGNTITRGIFSFVSGHKINDTQTGLRGFSIDMLPWLLQIKGKRYEYEMNQLLEAKSSGYKIHSISIKTIYENNNKGSHFHPLYDSIRIYLPIMKFSLSSVSCGIIDLLLFFILNWLTGNLVISVVGARIISSISNYLVNQKLVFKAKKYLTMTMVKYYCLAVMILVGNYLMIELFTQTSDIPLFFSKIFTEGLLFIVSYYAQRNFIF
ncbi:bifunctional glycosyltransferase family 2/GtrA family protein [Bacillus sp. USDA818B3_A]|uniref:bifunctional glycosyltransferase family 2/GtrA family protein n=1 Tax=Bacillus sp. USDA818B3_A TaxID=2698834 RepID=UPI001369B978|nr:bifunctional glycosyltransferase family 2/GtrA family protein [Bacillus sp. USDA818B3_A]